MAPTDRTEVLPSAGDVAYFVKLHLDTVRFVKHSDERKKIGLYEVEGKARPMLVCEVVAGNSGRCSFRVFPMTSIGVDGEGRPQQYRIPVGRLGFETTNSYVVADDIHRLPENMLSPDEDGECIIQSLGKLTLGHVIKIWQGHALRSGGLSAE